MVQPGWSNLDGNSPIFPEFHKFLCVFLHVFYEKRGIPLVPSDSVEAARQDSNYPKLTTAQSIAMKYIMDTFGKSPGFSGNISLELNTELMNLDPRAFPTNIDELPLIKLPFAGLESGPNGKCLPPIC